MGDTRTDSGPIPADATTQAGGQAGTIARAEEREVARTDEGKAALAEMTSVPLSSRVTAERRAIFLRELSRSPVVGTAARAAGIPLAKAYRLKGSDPRFSAAWDEALTVAVDRVEEVAIARAMRKSDKLMEMVLKAKRPEEYRERVDVAVALRGEIIVDLVEMD